MTYERLPMSASSPLSGILEAGKSPNNAEVAQRGPDGSHHCLPGRPGDWSIPERLRWRTGNTAVSPSPSPCGRMGGDNG